MRSLKVLHIILICLIITGFELNAQNCKKFHLYGKCMQYPGPFYKIEGQSRSNVIGVGDKLIYNVIFYGDRNYKLFFCTSDLFYPVHFVLVDDMSKKLIFDNSDNDYTETVELNIENTRRIWIEISVLANEAADDIADNYFGCLGFLMYWKPEGK
jgi:signal peptidase I